MAYRIPQEFINTVLDRVDIAELIGERMELKKGGRDLKGLCPFHGEKTPSFTVSQQKQFYYCFGCGASGTALTFLIEHDQMPFTEAVEVLASRAGLQVPKATSGRGEAPRNNDGPLYDALQSAAAFYQRVLKGERGAAARAYLAKRGFSEEISAAYGLGYAPDGWDTLEKSLDAPKPLLEKAGLLTRNERDRVYDRFRDRLMFPIRDGRGRIIAFGGRVLGEGEPKYLNSPETPVFHKRESLYGLFEMRSRRGRFSETLLVEGYLDVIALADAGVGNAVASLGTAATEAHFNLMFRTAPRVVCCFDGDNAGRRAARRAMETVLPVMRDGAQVDFLFLPDGEDPDTFVQRYGAEAFQKRISQALPLSQFMLRDLSEGLQLDLPEHRAKFISAAKPLLAKIPRSAFLDGLKALLNEQVARPASPPANAERGGWGAGQGGKRDAGNWRSGGRSGERSGKSSGQKWKGRGAYGEQSRGVPQQRRRYQAKHQLAWALTVLLTNPALAARVRAEHLSALAMRGDEAGDLLCTAIRYFHEFPDADVAELMGYHFNQQQAFQAYMGEPEYQGQFDIADEDFDALVQRIVGSATETAAKPTSIEDLGRFVQQTGKAVTESAQGPSEEAVATRRSNAQTPDLAERLRANRTPVRGDR